MSGALCSGGNKDKYLPLLSADDPFAIISALHFGPGTCIVSNDLFRQYIHLLDNVQLRTQFLKWQLQHQVNFTTFKGSGGDIDVNFKVRYHYCNFL